MRRPLLFSIAYCFVVVGSGINLPLNAFSPTNYDDKDLTSGTKLLVAFDPYKSKNDAKKEFTNAIQKSKIKVLKKYRYDQYYLIDCGMDAESVLAKIPHHAGAIAFSDGNPTKFFEAKDSKRTPGKSAVLNWGSSANGIRKMNSDLKKFSNMPGVIAKKIDLSNGRIVFGNPNMLKLSPGKGKTLLEVFLIAEAQFDYQVDK